MSALDRVACAARVLIHVHDTMPGDDLGARASAAAWIELRAAVAALPKGFDAETALRQLLVWGVKP